MGIITLVFFIMMFLIYYKIFRIADDIKEIKKIVKQQNECETIEKEI